MAWTPTAIQLQQRLNDRRTWFVNQWFFQWHHLSDGRHPVEVDLFNGQTSHMSGIKFCGSARNVYWDAITRGVRKEIIDQFAWMDDHVRRYERSVGQEAIDQCAGLLVSFSQTIRQQAVKKDRILRGNGREFPPEDDAGQWRGTSVQEILTIADALKRSIPFGQDASEEIGKPKGLAIRLNHAWHASQWWIGPVSVILAIAGLAVAFF